MSQVTKCQAFTKDGPQCSRNALLGEIYCTQHLEIYQELGSILIPDLTKNIVSDYLEYEEVKVLEQKFENFKINPDRVEIVERRSDTGILRSKETYIDGDLRIRENFYPKDNPSSIENFKNWREGGVNHGKFYRWYANGNLQFSSNWENGDWRAGNIFGIQTVLYIWRIII